MNKIGLLLVVASAMTMVAAPANAAELPAPEILTMHRDGDDIMWAEVSLSGSEGVVRIHIRAPRKERGSARWQDCSFGDTSEGTYRCGMDVAAGSIAAAHGGKWFARATVDGVVVDRESFRVGALGTSD